MPCGCIPLSPLDTSLVWISVNLLIIMNPFGSTSSGRLRHSNRPDTKSNSQYLVFHLRRVLL